METQKTVLIVDDDDKLTKVLGDQLERAGIKALTAKDGEEGLRSATVNKPDLILLDVMMPKMNGLQMLEKLREDSWGKDAKVILLTVVDQPDVLSKAVELGGFEYLVKTEWKIEEVIDRVKKKLGL